MQHIPTMDIRELGDIGFDGQLERALAPNEEYDVGKWLFVPSTYTEYRYILGTRGEKPLICIGINPSTARPGALDPTLKSVERIALGNGFDSFIMFNVYAPRATSPDDMEWVLTADLHRENMRAFDYYLWDCLQDMIAIGQGHDARWVKCGKTSAAGHPHHPLYLRADSPIEDFPVEQYAARRPAAKKKRRPGGGR